MNRIYWDEDKICFLTNQMHTEAHKHWVMQLFLSLEEDVELWVEGEGVVGGCIVVNKNTSHVFKCDKGWYFSILIAPTSSLYRILSQRMQGQNYYVVESPQLKEVRQLAQKLTLDTNKQLNDYEQFIDQLYECLHIQEEALQYDERIEVLLQLVDACICSDHSISEYGKEIALSQSRLVHLFKKQVGMPFKNYILLHQMKKAFIAFTEGQSITQAAMDAGFDSPSHFAATMKKMIGMSATLCLKDSQFLKVTSKKMK